MTLSGGAVMSLSILNLRVDGGTNPRADPVPTYVIEGYRDAIRAGAKFPPLKAVHDGTNYWLFDGFQTLTAYIQVGKDWPEVEVYPGTQQDAVRYSCAMNATHGCPRTNADKHFAVEKALRDGDWTRKSNRWIAEQCCVSEFLVRTVRGELRDSRSSDDEPEKRTGRDGKARKVPRRTYGSGTRKRSAITQAPPVLRLVSLDNVAENGAKAQNETQTQPGQKLTGQDPGQQVIADALKPIRDLLVEWPEEVSCTPVVEAVEEVLEDWKRLDQKILRLQAQNDPRQIPLNLSGPCHE